MAFLIESKHVVDNEWTMYTRAMPEEYGDVMWWSDEELGFLKVRDEQFSQSYCF